MCAQKDYFEMLIDIKKMAQHAGTQKEKINCANCNHSFL